ncbi:LuxR family transcriptional regulator protein (plasmid) [Rhizobium phaseoli]|uniref:helix-turn-helix transcriptional regulator n=1 Tax=Rhizobium phaseoli TaxID=396 RepID=UPI0007E9DC33|nr:LuxR family transcriptional regulator [Rhizobium phaseoli]ANL31954.1 LuxR family transcriptional regulator protein [Rhizobium phaseoli]
MEMAQQLEDAFNSISNAKSLDDLRKTMRDLREPLGLANIVYHALRLPKTDALHPLLLLTYEPEWVRRYIENDYFKIDPVVIYGRRGFLPVDWSEVDRETMSAKRFFSEADEFGVGRQGLTMPIRGPGGERALFTVTANISQDDWQKRRFAYMRSFQLMGHFVHDRAVQLGGFRFANRSPELSRREKECLQAIAKGKAPKQIASDLKLSISAVQLYLQSARQKLGCKSIAEAAVISHGLELLEN